MKKLIAYFKNHFKLLKYGLVILFILFIGSVTFFSIKYFVQFSSFTIGLAKAIIGIFLLKLVDDIIFHKIDTVQAINDKNVAYAIIYIGNALIVFGCIAMS